jgi:hypothetical protein
MYKLHCRVFFMIIAAIGIIASVPDGSAQVVESQKLPPQIAALVPPGTRLTGQSVSISALMANITFFAEKKSGLRSQSITQYHLTFQTFADNDYYKQMLAPANRKQVETDSKQKAQNWGAGQSAMVSPPEVTQYPWGSGMTQRRRFYGDGAPDFYSYQCAYFGLAGTTRFELTVDEIADRAEADKWATKVAETAAKITLSSISK